MSLPTWAFTSQEDLGSRFRVVGETEVWWSFVAGDPGSMARLRKAFPALSRFSLVARVEERRGDPSGAGEDAYEAVLALLDRDAEALSSDTPDEPFSIDNDYLERVRRAGVPGAVVARVSGVAGSYASRATLERALEAALGSDDFAVHSAELVTGSRTIYLWSIAGGQRKIKPEQPDLQPGDQGIDVVTLQTWLRLAGMEPGPADGLLGERTAAAAEAFRQRLRIQEKMRIVEPDGLCVSRRTWSALERFLERRLQPEPSTLEQLPFPDRIALGDDAARQKALFEGLRRFGIRVAAQTTPFVRRIPVAGSGVAEVSDLPSGDYSVHFIPDDSEATRPQGSIRLRFFDAQGRAIRGTVYLEGSVGSFDLSGKAIVVAADVAAGDYALSFEASRTRTPRGDETGGTSIRLLTPEGGPAAGVIELAGETGDPEALQRGVRLLRALVRRVPVDPADPRLANILSGVLDEESLLRSAWGNLDCAWGVFFGAPWMGIVLAPPEGLTAEDCGWTNGRHARLLREWGRRYLDSAGDDPEELARRLTQPITIQRLAGPLGSGLARRQSWRLGDAELHVPGEPRRFEAWAAAIRQVSPRSTVVQTTRAAEAFVREANPLPPLTESRIWLQQNLRTAPGEPGVAPRSAMVLDTSRGVLPTKEMLLGVPVTVLDKWNPSESGDHNATWYYVELQHDTTLIGMDQRTKMVERDAKGVEVVKTKAKRGLRGWMKTDGVIGGVPWQRFVDDLARWESHNPWLHFDQKLTILRKLCHDERFEKEFDSVLGATTPLPDDAWIDGKYDQPPKFADRPFIGGPWQIGVDFKCVRLPNGKWVDIQHLLVGLEALKNNRRGEGDVNLAVSIGGVEVVITVRLIDAVAAASWSGDIGAAAAECLLKQGEPESFFKRKAPDWDLLGNVYAWELHRVLPQASTIAALLDAFASKLKQRTHREIVECFAREQLGVRDWPQGLAEEGPRRKLIYACIFHFAHIWYYKSRPWLLVKDAETKEFTRWNALEFTWFDAEEEIWPGVAYADELVKVSRKMGDLFIEWLKSSAT